MKRLFALFALFPLPVLAADVPASVTAFIGKVATTILNPIIALMFGLATVYFIYGVVGYVWNPESEEARTKGAHQMLWGLIGMAIMVSVFGIMRAIISTIGADVSIMDNV